MLLRKAVVLRFYLANTDFSMRCSGQIILKKGL